MLIGVLFAMSLLLLAVVIFIKTLKIRTRQKVSVCLLFVAAFIYTVSYIAELGSAATANKLLFNNTQYIGIVAIAPLWYIISLQYRNGSSRLNPKNILLMFLIPAITLLANWTHEINGLFYASYRTSNEFGANFLLFEKGVMYYIHILYQNFLEICSIINYLFVFKKAAGMQKRQSFMLLLLSVFGFAISSFCYVGKYTGHVDISVIFIGLSAVLLVVALFKYELFDLLPLAYRSVFECSDNPIMVLDNSFRIVKSNTNARAVFGDMLRTDKNVYLLDILNGDTQFFESLINKKDCLINKSVGKERLYFEAKLIGLDGNKDNLDFGYLLTLTNQTMHINRIQNLETAAHTDPLTGIYNRKYFFENADKMIKRAKDRQRPSSIAMFDIDRFKSINDRYGHLAGDYILKSVCDIIKNELREKDLFARYGGEEFVALLPGADEEQAKAVLDRICCLIREKDFTFGERSIKVTISGGLSTIVPSGSLSLEEGIALADGALYRAKERGRDSVCLHIDSENE